MIDGGVHWLCWMDTEECLWCRREQYKLRRDRETPEEAEWRRPRNWECLRHQRAAIPVKQRRLVIRNLQVSTLIWDLVCILAHSLTWTHIYHDKHHWSITWDHFLCFQQQQRGSAHWHALSLIDHGDASDSEDLDEWDWRSMSEDDDQDNDKYCTVQMITTPVNYIIVIIVNIIVLH